MMENSTVMEIEDESASSVKKKKDNEGEFDFHDCEKVEPIKNATEKLIEVKKKGTNYFSFNWIFFMSLNVCCYMDPLIDAS